jgi:6-pyruvoyltetrahydropterin/6-carboxytetrahydropterin synthase
VYDFKNLKDKLKAVLDVYDHNDLNKIKPFDTISPTAENLARIICEGLQTSITEPHIQVKEVAVWESPIAKLVYRP